MGKRLFAAIHLHPDATFTKQFLSLQQLLSVNRIKWVEPENIHITLKFFGETADEKIPGICKALANACNEQAVFPVKINEIGIFGSEYKPRVVMLRVAETHAICMLQQKITEELTPLGYIPDRQNFVPHLTLGRINHILDKQLFQQSLNHFRYNLNINEHAHELLLFESILHPNGPVYKPIEWFKFSATASL